MVEYKPSIQGFESTKACIHRSAGQSQSQRSFYALELDASGKVSHRIATGQPKQSSGMEGDP